MNDDTPKPVSETSTAELVEMLSETEVSAAQIEQFLRGPNVALPALLQVLRFQPETYALRNLLHSVLAARARLN